MKKIFFLPVIISVIVSIPFFTACSKTSQSEENVIYYSDFGAKGRGRESDNDFAAIIAAHQEANATGATVKADKGAVYYIGKTSQTAHIRTNVDWGNARFIIDDTDISGSPEAGSWIFLVERAASVNLYGKINSLKKNQTTINNLGLEQDSLVLIKNSNIRRFIRSGGYNESEDQSDILLVSKAGKVSSSTPVYWDYDTTTSVRAYPIDKQILTVKGGRFTTLANRSGGTSYYSRGIRIERSNTIVEGITHYVQNEKNTGSEIETNSPPYLGFVHANTAAHIKIKDCVFTGRAANGSYDLFASNVANLEVINCSQTNDIDDNAFWGTIATNFCKNVTFDRVNLSRIDAHRGVRDVTIKNSRLGWQGIRMTGSGLLSVENTTVSSRNFLTLRSDYGAWWDGTVKIKNCIFAPPMGWSRQSAIFDFYNIGTHDYGYSCMMPKTIYIDGLTVEDFPALNYWSTPYEGIMLFTDFNPSYTGSEAYPYGLTDKIYIKRLVTKSGVDFYIPNETLKNHIKINPPKLNTWEIIVIILGSVAAVAGTTICVFFIVKKTHTKNKVKGTKKIVQKQKMQNKIKKSKVTLHAASQKR